MNDGPNDVVGRDLIRGWGNWGVLLKISSSIRTRHEKSELSKLKICIFVCPSGSKF